MSNLWLFGYGSLIWRPDFPYLARHPARITGFTRRFWQGSHDHRGLPHAPGRVVTLVPDPESVCDGMAYLIEAEVAEATFAHLDHREKNGYERHDVRLDFHDGAGDIGTGNVVTEEIDTPTMGVVYIATEDNFAFLGPAPLPAMVSQIRGAAGPSGTNLEYLLELARALRDIGAHDPHVYELEACVQQG